MHFKAKCLDEAAEQSRGNCIVREDQNGLFAWLRSWVCWHRDPFGENRGYCRKGYTRCA